MFPYLILLFAFKCIASSSDGYQQLLHDPTQPSNFIRSSIFGRDSFDVNQLQDPVILAPVNDEEGLYSGLGTFAHLPFTDCSKLANSGTFDIGIIGHPFDLGVSYRPGARFGPNGARQGARRLSPSSGWRSVVA
jgi:agmatinase